MVQISRYQLILIMVWTVLGTGIVTIPASIAQFTVEDAWLAAPSVVLGGAVCALLAWFHVWLFPELTLTQVFRTVFGRWTGDLLSAWYAL
ncbi:MAG: spore germination protein, partial [Alicyclobacillus sp.]|nr:spore germination protein [Alicyclobacillus sp.]